MVGGEGDDTIHTSTGANVIGYNSDDGMYTV
jgi:hypothetical protein